MLYSGGRLEQEKDRTMKSLLKYLKNYKLESFVAPLLKMTEAGFELFIPLVVASIIDDGINKSDMNHIFKMGLLLPALAVIGLVCAITAQYFAAKAATGFSFELRQSLFNHIQKFSFDEIDKIGTSTLITRMTSDINQLQNGVNMVLRLFLRSPIIVFGAMIMAFTVNVQAALIFVVAIPMLALVVFSIMAMTIPIYKKVQSKLDQVLLKTRENLTGVRVIRAFGKEEEEIKNYNSEINGLTDLQIFVGNISNLMNPITFIIVNFATIILIYTGAIKVDQGILSQGKVIALVNYMSQILVELVKLANLIILITKALACASRIESIFETKPSMVDGHETKSSAGDITVEFENVSFKYKGASAESVKNLSFIARRGQSIGIIGGTGSGKTSIVNLVPRFYDATEGTVSVLGRNVKDYDSSFLRSRIGNVMQKAVLFKGTVRSNLLWGNENASDEELIEALKLAQAYDFIFEDQAGLDRVVEQGGKNFSGGQRQRLSIARALVRKPDILILDDSSSALDFATDAKLRRAVSTLKDMTVFIISQRTASIMQADHIIVVDDGDIVGQGTHKELLDNCQVYREIYDSQYGREEEIA